MYGSACSVTQGPNGDDLDTAGVELSDERVIVEDMFLAATVAAAALPWAPEDTVNVADQLGRTGSDAECAVLARQIEDCFTRDERYIAVTATVTKPKHNKLRVEIVGEADSGTFELVLEQGEGQPMRVVKLG